MTTFVYSYIDDGADGQELRYSLRGLDRYWLGRADIVLVGDRPSWVNDEDVQCVPMMQDRGGLPFKQRNILRSVVAGAVAVYTSGLHEAVMMDDDYVLLDYAGQTPLVYGDPWGAQMRKVKLFDPTKEWLRTAYVATDRLMTSMQAPAAFELHRPMPVYVDDLIKMLTPLADRDPQTTPLWRTLWGNLQRRYSIYPGRDVRTTGTFPRGTSWVSTDSAHGWGTVSAQLAKMLPEPSRWER